MLSIHTPRGEAATITLDAIERRIVRNALDYYTEGVEKQVKALEKASLSAEEARFVLSAIDGTEGFGRGIRSRFMEPGTLHFGEQGDLLDDAAATDDTARAASEDECRRIAEALRTAFEDECRRIAEALLSREEWPEGRYADALATMVRAWTPVERAEALDYVAVADLDTPACVANAYQRVLELLLSDDEVSQWASQGPWEVASDTHDGTDVAYFYALRADTTPIQADPATFDTEAQAWRRVAWLNRAEQTTPLGVVS